MTNRPTHIEVRGGDPRGNAEFYAAVFGWDVEQWQDQDYWFVITTDDPTDGPNLATAPAEPGEGSQSVVITIEVDDADAVAAAIEANGGTIVRPKAPVPTVGWLLHARDRAGVVFGVMQLDPTAGVDPVAGGDATT